MMLRSSPCSIEPPRWTYTILLQKKNFFTHAPNSAYHLPPSWYRAKISPFRSASMDADPLPAPRWMHRLHLIAGQADALRCVPCLLRDVPFDVLVHVFRMLSPSDIRHVALMSRHFFFGPPVRAGGAAASPVAETLRQRAMERAVAVPADLPTWAPTWSAYFLARELQHLQEEPPIAAGRHHSLLVDATGQLLQCGAGESSPSPVRALADVRVRSVVADSLHSFAVSHDGRVYSWGSGSLGELGHGDTEQRLQPTLVAGLSGVHVRSVVIGCGHGLAVSILGAVYSWGSGAHGCISYPFSSGVALPRRVDALAGVQVRCVAAARAASLAVSEQIHLYAWGRHRCFTLALERYPIKKGLHHTLKIPHLRPISCVMSHSGTSQFVFVV